MMDSKKQGQTEDPIISKTIKAFNTIDVRLLVSHFEGASYSFGLNNKTSYVFKEFFAYINLNSDLEDSKSFWCPHCKENLLARVDSTPHLLISYNDSIRLLRSYLRKKYIKKWVVRGSFIFPVLAGIIFYFFFLKFDANSIILTTILSMVLTLLLALIFINYKFKTKDAIIVTPVKAKLAAKYMHRKINIPQSITIEGDGEYEYRHILAGEPHEGFETVDFSAMRTHLAGPRFKANYVYANQAVEEVLKTKKLTWFSEK